MDLVSDCQEQEQSEDSEGSGLGPTCLRFPLILRQILQHCSNPDLIQLSLVNKQWNYEARSVLKDRSSIIANLGPDEPCQELALLASQLQEMNIVPFCGISINFDLDEEEDDDHEETCEACSSETMDAILKGLPWKHFAASFNSHWDELYQNCPAFLLAKKILEDYSEVLEGLTLFVPCNFEEFIRQVIPNNCTFPCLKTFHHEGSFSSSSQLSLERSARMFIKTMVSLAPNLQELHIDEPMNLYEDLLEGSSAVLVVHDAIDPLSNPICRGPVGALRLTRMLLEYNSYYNFSIDRMNRILPGVLSTSRTTLLSLSFNSVFAPSLMRYGIRLENVTELQMCLNGQLDLPAPEGLAADVSTFVRILRDFDFSHIFPKLNQIEISSSHLVSPQDISQFADEGSVVLQEPAVDRAVKIKHLTLKYSPINVPFLAAMVPHIETLVIENLDGPPPPFGFIWELWVHLKQLEVHSQAVWRENLDSLFCGLFPEEIAELREQDEDYLKAVNIVPVMPSITSLKELRTFKLSNTGYGFFYGENDPTFTFSKVTALIAFSRCPDLSVNLQISSKWENAWSHMKKYASVVVV